MLKGDKTPCGVDDVFAVAVLAASLWGLQNLFQHILGEGMLIVTDQLSEGTT